MVKHTRKTWTNFWGELFQVRFHENSPDHWSILENRARWLFDTLPLTEGSRILDLGCGNGVLDICLARLGAQVTGVDLIGPVLDEARSLAQQESVTFICEDLRELNLPPATFDVVLIFGLAGLMGASDDAALIAASRRWLAASGNIMIDCPLEPAQRLHSWSREFDDGVLEVEWEYDPSSRIHHGTPVFRKPTNEVIELHDPYDSSRPDHTGLLGYIYPKLELVDLLSANGFSVRKGEHHARDGDYLLIGDVSPQSRHREELPQA